MTCKQSLLIFRFVISPFDLCNYVDFWSTVSKNSVPNLWLHSFNDTQHFHLQDNVGSRASVFFCPVLSKARNSPLSFGPSDISPCHWMLRAQTTPLGEPRLALASPRPFVCFNLFTHPKNLLSRLCTCVAGYQGCVGVIEGSPLSSALVLCVINSKGHGLLIMS